MASNRLDVNHSAVNNSVDVTGDSIQFTFMLLSLDAMTGGPSQFECQGLDYVPVDILEGYPRWDLLSKLRVVY
jgi:hypothetical protein